MTKNQTLEINGRALVAKIPCAGSGFAIIESGRKVAQILTFGADSIAFRVDEKGATVGASVTRETPETALVALFA